MKKLVSFVLVFALVVPVFVGAQDADRATDAVSLEKRIYGLEVSVRSLQDQVGKILQILSSMTTTRPTISTAPLPSDPTKNLAPIAMADVARTTVGTAVYVNVLANDRDPEGGKLSIVWADTFAPVMTKGGGYDYASE